MSIQTVLEEVEQADVAVSVKAAELRHNPATRAAGAVSELADQPPMFALGAVLLAAGLLAGRPRLAEAGGGCSPP